MAELNNWSPALSIFEALSGTDLCMFNYFFIGGFFARV
jgi:hypothetical protein